MLEVMLHNLNILESNGISCKINERKNFHNLTHEKFKNGADYIYCHFAKLDMGV